MSGIQQMMAGMVPGGAIPTLGGTSGGSLEQFQELQKALQASNYQTDVATLEGGGALTVQSLDTAMKTTIQENEHFVLFNRLNATKATNIVDEYVRQSSVGGFLGGSTNSQMGVVRAAQGEYSREVGLVKFLMSLRQVGYVLNIGKNIVEATAVEERNGALQLLTDAEYLLFHGNADAAPTQFDGIFNIIDKEIADGKMPEDNIVDLDGAKLDSVEAFGKINTAVSRYGSWGRSTDVFLPNSVQNDLNMGLDPAYRWVPQGNNTPMLGGHVEGIRLQHGVLRTNMDTFIHDEEHPMVKPFEVNYASVAAANVAFKPASVTAATASDAASKFSAARAGNFYYGVAAIGANGEGLTAVTLTTQTAVAAGQKVTLTIAQSASGTESGYAIYRSRQNGTNAAADLRLVKIVKKAGATTTFVDLNRDIPGTVSIPLLNLGPSADAIGWRQYQPMTKIPLPFGVGGVPVISWFQFLFGYLRVTKPKHHGYIKNILPSNAKWRPFTAE
ncbi:major capsid protein [Bordetella phage vB_BbrM_PHB04]|uniref:Major capsid protein n=1 Tax=Bordetella phage vB_BbrM_PHB04 TaxID=2029657 RepID=A0A291LAK5_9CAUD|nr:major head protein [Bordetella phage vB_BbrM_PHB04]ATI15638.1 major capsid protein [Bordetella phage vB_BbrM_PHB04]